MNIEKLNEFIRKMKKEDCVVGLTNGCFDILHAGHVKMFKECKKHCDILVVAVNDDESVRMLKGEGRPVNTLADRLEVLDSLVYVDATVSFSGKRADKLFKELKGIDVYIKGDDYSIDTLDKSEKEALLSANPYLKFVFIKKTPNLSTSGIIEKASKNAR